MTRLVVLVFGPRDMRLTRSQISPRFARLVSGTGATRVTVVHGDMRGVDRDCDEWAKMMGYAVEPFPYPQGMGTSGGPIRNRAMAKRLHEMRDVAIVCGLGWRWERWTNGTKNMAETLAEYEIPYRMEVVAR